MTDVTNLSNRRAVERWERVSVGDLFERLTWSYPDKEAIVACDGAFADPALQRVTYRQADAIANRIANALLARGLQRDDRVLLFCENSVEAYLTKFGIAKAGLTCVPINPLLAPDVIGHLIDRVQPRFAIVDAVLWPKAQEAFAAHGVNPDVTIEIGGGIVPGGVSFREFIADADTAEPDVEIHADDVWQIIFTSGTTALPKGAMVSHNYSYLAAYSFALTLTRGLKFECDLRLCSFLPLIYHIADQIFSFPAFLSGGTLIMGRGYDPAKIASAVTKERATALWSGSPAMLTDLVAVLEREPLSYDVSSLTTAVYGWTAAPPGLLAALKRHCGDDLVVCEILGQTEAISCHRFWPDKWRDTFLATSPAHNYVGVPNPLVAGDVVDDEGRSLRDRPGVPGEVVYRSPVVTAGYYKDEAATQEAFRGGWFHSGDVCEYDADGLRIMVDRSKDIVKSGGENVSSLRVEAVLHQHPDVQKAAVVGLPHEHWGEAVTAFVVAAPGRAPDPDALIAWSRGTLAGFEAPKRIVLVQELPVTVGGKVLKYKLRAENKELYE
ncbi:class I adenylate-forming enzyme family protein [Conexibacter sp. CPCC 206217]|uniref:class I adenylate-forming enzyme family protein n=1 Tax=Conexibacter sp. CPCC 206217 TaxID=3064574 RepID=UPI0027205B75|nr:AMP-binding protein [Conexibacter sp. CPCC 206217]MDO8212443.1 AMP-binding protein [Conexibacter sp. CPCC 206217]